MVPDLDPDKTDPDPVLPDQDPVKSGSGSVFAGSRSGLLLKRHGHGSVQALLHSPAIVYGATCKNSSLLQVWLSLVSSTEPTFFLTIY